MVEPKQVLVEVGISLDSVEIVEVVSAHVQTGDSLPPRLLLNDLVVFNGHGDRSWVRALNNNFFFDLFLLRKLPPRNLPHVQFNLRTVGVEVAVLLGLSEGVEWRVGLREHSLHFGRVFAALVLPSQLPSRKLLQSGVHEESLR